MGPGVLVTIGTSPKFFSNGFSLSYWMQDHELNPLVSTSRLQALCEKVLSFNMPSMAVLNGHTYAGGFVFAMCHDFRIMKSTKALVCLSEINLGFSLGTAGLLDASKDTLPKKAFRELILGIAWDGPKAKDGDVVDDLFTDMEDSEAKIKQFAKKYSKVGTMREGIKRNK